MVVISRFIKSKRTAWMYVKYRGSFWEEFVSARERFFDVYKGEI